jgi:hypothetical protein
MLENNEQFKKLEKQLDVYFIEKAPYQIPETTKDTLIKILPWLVLVGTVLSVLPLLAILGVNLISSITGGFAPLKYLSDIILIVQVIAMVISISGLFKYQKESWNFLFLALLLSILSGLISWLSYPLAIFTLFTIALRTVVFLYLLFQLKNKYN